VKQPSKPQTDPYRKKKHTAKVEAPELGTEANKKRLSKATVGRNREKKVGTNTATINLSDLIPQKKLELRTSRVQMIKGREKWKNMLAPRGPQADDLRTNTKKGPKDTWGG